MSELAAGYYQERAERLGLTAFPLVLNGQPWSVLEGSRDHNYLSIHQPNERLLATADTSYRQLLHSISPLLLEATFGTLPATQPFSPDFERYYGSNDTENSNSVLEYLLNPNPGKLKTGRIYDLQVEAVARSEVNQDFIDLATAEEIDWEARQPNAEDHSVYLLTSAMLHAGRPLGHVACLTVAYVNRLTLGGNPRFVEAFDKRNELLAESGLWESRANRAAITEWSVANPQTTSGAEKRSKGRHRPGN